MLIRNLSSFGLSNKWLIFNNNDEVVDAIAECDTDFQDQPLDPQVIKTIRITN